MGPHVDTFVLSQREEQRRKDLIHKVCMYCWYQLTSHYVLQEQLEAQIAERRRQREAERLKHELEEREAELKVRREIEEMNKRNERERERQRHKAVSLAGIVQRRWILLLTAGAGEGVAGNAAGSN